MSEDIEQELKQLRREVKLYKQTFEQNRNIDKKYRQTLQELKEIKENLELKVEQRTKSLAEKEQFLQSVINGVEDSVIVINSDYSVNMMNRSLKKLVHQEYVSDKNRPKCYEVLQYRCEPCDEGNSPLDIECPLRKILKTQHADKTLYKKMMFVDSIRDVEAISSPLWNNEHQLTGIIQIHRDVTAHLQLQENLEKQKTKFDYQAHYDPLTNLPNRLFFNEKILESIKDAQRKKTKIALLFIDLDRFKQVNDTLGHDYGDKVLQESTSRIQLILRANDILFRLGGDEFIIIMENVENIHAPSKLAFRIIQSLQEPIEVNSHTIYISSSIGISIYPDDALYAVDLLKYADSAMYKAKDEGRSNFQFYSNEITTKVSEDFEMEIRLRDAIKKDEFEVYYQPQFNLDTKQTTGFEALARWNHPTLGFIQPDKFIPLAEETGLIVHIDEIIMNKALNDFSNLRSTGLEPGKLAINVSVKKLETKDYVQQIQDTLKKHAFKANLLELEVTESDIMNKPDENITKLNLLHELGIEIAIDDFGTGYSSLSYLKKMPISKIKIDKSFIDGLPNDNEDAKITKAVIALSQSFNLKTIAEGVETKEQEEFLYKNGCVNIQGYLHAKPMSIKDVEIYLQKS